MIGFVRGILVYHEPPLLLVDVNGVGYELEAPLSTCIQLPAVGSEVQLRTHLLVREDQHTLYGFGSELERSLFRSLLKVSGVGAKLAITILSGISVDDFAQAIQTEDTATLVRMPGVGRKTAERLIVEMRDRIDKISGSALSGVKLPSSGAASSRTEAFNALVSLGYKQTEVRRMLEKADTESASTEEILREVLKSAAPVN